jgi:hypothetical protein
VPLCFKTIALPLGFAMNKHLETIQARYFELSKEFLSALQNDRPSDELEVIRQQIKDVVAKMRELDSQEPAQGETSS